MLKAIAATLVIVTTSLAQPPEASWREYNDGDGQEEKFADIYHLQNGGFVMAGWTDSLWLKKVDEQGNEVWTYRHDKFGLCTVIEADGGDVIAGGQMPNYQFGAIRLSGRGDLRWQRGYADGLCSAIIELKGGDFVLSGRDGRVMRITGNGDVVWSHTYRIDQPGNAYILRSIRETDDGIVVAGSYRSTGGQRTREKGWVLKLRLDGQQVWSRSYPAPYMQDFTAMVSIPGGFAICGTEIDTVLNMNDQIWAFCLTKIDSDGEETFRRVYWRGGRTRDYARSIAKFDDGGFCLVGRMWTSGDEPEHPLIIRTNRTGDMVWSNDFSDRMEGRRRHHPFQENEITSAVIVGQNEIVACGGVSSEDDHLGPSGLWVRMEPDQLQPYIFRKSPEDSLQTLLAGDSLDFVVRARDRQGHEMRYRWVYRNGEDSLEVGGNDTTVTIRYDQVGITTLECWVSNDDWTVITGWQITTHDLFIRSHSPDTLSLTIHHGETVPFAMSVAATPGDDPTYLWTLTDWAGGRFDTLGTDSTVSHLFDHGGNYLMEGMASRGASADTVAWNIRVLSNVVAYHPDRTRLTLPQDTTVVFSVEPSEFDTGQYRYEWLVDGGWCSDSASAQVGFPFLGQSVVKVVVADSAEADTIVWVVEVVEPNTTPPTPPSIEGGDYPHNFRLGVYPNPFNHRTAIRYTVPNRGEVRVSAYDVSGRLVKELYRGDRYPGEYSILWQAPAAGVYLIQVETGGEIRRVVKAVCLP